MSKTAQIAVPPTKNTVSLTPAGLYLNATPQKPPTIRKGNGNGAVGSESTRRNQPGSLSRSDFLPSASSLPRSAGLICIPSRNEPDSKLGS